MTASSQCCSTVKEEKEMWEAIKKSRGYKKKHRCATMVNLHSEVSKSHVTSNSSDKGDKADER